MNTELVTIAHEFSSLKANLVRSRLEADGIECFLSGETLASIVGSPSSMGNEIRIQVQDFDANQARRILREVEDAPRDEYDAENWVQVRPNLAVQVLRGLIIGGVIWYVSVASFGITQNWVVSVSAGIFAFAMIILFQVKTSFKSKR